MEEAFATPEGAHKDALMERVYFAMKEAMPLVARELVKLPMTDGAAEHAGPPFGRYSFKAGKDIGAQVLDLVKAVESDFPPVSRLHEIEKMVKSRAAGLEVPTILPTFNGPYNVTGMREMLNSRGEALDAKVSMNLCRCGGSANKPFCDMTHVRIGFRDTNELDPAVNQRDDYEAAGTTIHDNRGICSHIGLCTDNLKKVFRLREEPWIHPDAESAEKIAAQVKKYPSGALSHSIGDFERRNLVRHPSITVSKNGPYFVSGTPDLEVDEARWLEGASREHFTLCRCGQSRNKPFCDGSHWRVNFIDDKN